jgi:hypothetical protein
VIACEKSGRCARLFSSASGFAADTVKKKEELTAEQKTEIRDRAERLKTERAKAEQGKRPRPPHR